MANEPIREVVVNGTTYSIEADTSAIEAQLTAEDDLEFQFSKSGSDYGYKDANGNFVPFKNPTGTKSITANGTYDITDYASASVNVPTSSFSSVQNLTNNTAYTYNSKSLYIGVGVIDSNNWTVRMYYNGSEILSKGGAYSGTSLISITRSDSTITISNTGYQGFQARLY